MTGMINSNSEHIVYDDYLQIRSSIPWFKKSVVEPAGGRDKKREVAIFIFIYCYRGGYNSAWRPPPDQDPLLKQKIHLSYWYMCINFIKLQSSSLFVILWDNYGTSDSLPHRSFVWKMFEIPIGIVSLKGQILFKVHSWVLVPIMLNIQNVGVVIYPLIEIKLQLCSTRSTCLWWLYLLILVYLAQLLPFVK